MSPSARNTGPSGRRRISCTGIIAIIIATEMVQGLPGRSRRPFAFAGSGREPRPLSERLLVERNAPLMVGAHAVDIGEAGGVFRAAVGHAPFLAQRAAFRRHLV